MDLDLTVTLYETKGQRWGCSALGEKCSSLQARAWCCAGKEAVLHRWGLWWELSNRGEGLAISERAHFILMEGRAV